MLLTMVIDNGDHHNRTEREDCNASNSKTKPRNDNANGEHETKHTIDRKSGAAEAPEYHSELRLIAPRRRRGRFSSTSKA